MRKDYESKECKLYFVTKKDLWNVMTKYKLTPGLRDRDDVTSLELREQERNPSDGIRFFKKQDEPSGKGFVLAFLLSGEMTAKEVKILFDEIKKIVPNFAPKSLVSDEALAFYNGFKSSFPDREEETVQEGQEETVQEGQEETVQGQEEIVQERREEIVQESTFIELQPEPRGVVIVHSERDPGPIRDIRGELHALRDDIAKSYTMIHAKVNALVRQEDENALDTLTALAERLRVIAGDTNVPLEAAGIVSRPDVPAHGRPKMQKSELYSRARIRKEMRRKTQSVEDIRVDPEEILFCSICFEEDPTLPEDMDPEEPDARETHCEWFIHRTKHGGALFHLRCNRRDDDPGERPRAICSCFLNVRISGIGPIIVHGCFGHIGHKVDVSLRSLSLDEELFLKTLLEEYSMDHVLALLERDFSLKASRLAHVTREDLCDISKKYQLIPVSCEPCSVERSEACIEESQFHHEAVGDEESQYCSLELDVPDEELREPMENNGSERSSNLPSTSQHTAASVGGWEQQNSVESDFVIKSDMIDNEFFDDTRGASTTESLSPEEMQFPKTHGVKPNTNVFTEDETSKPSRSHVDDTMSAFEVTCTEVPESERIKMAFLSNRKRWRCYLCSRVMVRRFIQTHLRGIHKLSQEQLEQVLLDLARGEFEEIQKAKRTTMRCPVCEEKVKNHFALAVHCDKFHRDSGADGQPQDYTVFKKSFGSNAIFEEWLTELCERTTTSLIRRNVKGCSYQLRCPRVGRYKKTESKKTPSKRKYTINCPCFLNVNMSKTGGITVYGCFGHAGHTVDVTLLRLNQTQVLLLKRLLEEYSVNHIISLLKEQYSTKTSRLAHVTLKDLQNVAKRYGLKVTEYDECRNERNDERPADQAEDKVLREGHVSNRRKGNCKGGDLVQNDSKNSAVVRERTSRV
nr:Protein R02D3.7 [Haemonchus contortus]